MSNPTSTGIDSETLQEARDIPSPYPEDCKETPEEAFASSGWQRPDKDKPQAASDVYSTRAAKEVHDFMLKHRLPLSLSNDLLKLLKEVSPSCCSC
jgi:hypothetical protein